MRYVVRFSGRVQGVGFRATCTFAARDLDVHGFVRNECDGSVLLDVDGPIGHLDELMRRIESEMAGKIDGVHLEKFESQDRTDGLRITY